MGDIEILIFAFIFFPVALFISVLLHEVGHLLAYRLFGRKVEKCIIGKNESRALIAKSFFGTNYIFKVSSFYSSSGVTISSEVSRLSEIEIKIIAIAGPLMNLVLSIIFFYFLSHHHNTDFTYIFYLVMVCVNGGMFVMNLYPSTKKPSDGALFFHTAKMHGVLAKMIEEIL